MILRAPAATEEAGKDTDSPASITSAWVRDTRAMFNPAPVPEKPKEAEPKKETDGQADSPERRVSEQPVKPAVAGDPGPAAPAKEVKPEPAKAPAVEDWESAPTPKGVPEKDFQAWKKGRKESETKLKAEIKAAQDKLAETESRIATLSKAEPTEIPVDIKNKIDSQENEIKQLRTALMEADVTKDVRWKNYFEGGKSKIIERAKKVVGPERAEEIATILNLKDEEYRSARLNQFIDETESTSVSMQLNVQLDKLAQLDEEQATEYKRIQDHNGTLAQERQARAEREQQERVVSFKKIAQELSDPEKGFSPYQKNGDPAWDQEVDKRNAYVEAILTGKGKELDGTDIKPETIMRGAFFAAAMPVVLQIFDGAVKKWEKEKADYEAKIQTLTAAQPGAGGDITEDNEPGKVKLTPDMDPQAATREFAKSAARMAMGG